ncbi:YqaJ viral recombinase family protein [Streptomyces sp. NPDC056387]|uniref:YqaJ viral recombinase family nuclease n=1 Tax=Streptomyces sp. NPDC056387 TaxID=3345803 RepID=UPI0035D839B9
MTETVQAGALAPAAGRRVTPTGRLILDHTAPRDVWLNARRLGIGSSDLPAVLSLSGFKTPQHVYYDKRGELPHDDEFSEAAHFGTIFEEPLALDWARRTRTVVERIGVIANIDEPWQMCSLDRLCTECPYDRTTRSLCALEVKCRNAFVAKLWRTGPPDDVLAQVLWQILVTGLDHIHVMCLIGGNDPRMYTVRREDHTKLVAYIHAEASRLWFEHIVPGRPPAIAGDEPPDALIELYDRLHPDRDGVVVMDRDGDAQGDLSEYLRAVADKGEAEKRRKTYKARLLAHLGGAQAATVMDRPFYSIEQSMRETPDLERLRAEFPEAYAACVADKPQDRLSIPKNIREEYQL